MSVPLGIRKAGSFVLAMKDTTIPPPPAGVSAVPSTPTVAAGAGGTPPEPTATPNAEPGAQAGDGALTTPSQTPDAPVDEPITTRFALGLELGRMRLNAADASVGVVRIAGTYSTPLGGSQMGSHTAMVYQAGLDFGGDRKLAMYGASAFVGARGALAVTGGGSQVYAQAGPTGNVGFVSDARSGPKNPYASAGVGGRLEAGYALAYGPDAERRIQISAYGEVNTNHREVGVAVRALSF